MRRHHRGRIERLHPDGFNRQIHARLHVIVEDQVALGEPAITGATVARLAGQGLRRHFAVHMVGEVLLRALTSGQPFDEDAWTAALRGLDAGEWLGAKMRRDLGAPES